jgi:hypothetical protein
MPGPSIKGRKEKEAVTFDVLWESRDQLNASHGGRSHLLQSARAD